MIEKELVDSVLSATASNYLKSSSSGFDWLNACHVGDKLSFTKLGVVQKTAEFADAFEFTVTSITGEKKYFRKYAEADGEFTGTLVELDYKTLLPKKEIKMSVENCNFCGHELSGDTASANRFFDSVEAYEVDRWADQEVESIIEYNGVTALLVSKKTSIDTGDIDPDHFYGEYPQDSSFDMWLVLRIGDSFFKISGYGDSYGHVSWGNFKVKKVTPEISTVTNYK